MKRLNESSLKPLRKTDLGVGIGLRSTHYGHILNERPSVPWFEVISENVMGTRGSSGGVSWQGGRPAEILDQIRQNYPIMLHGVSLNIGSADPLRKDYLKRLKELTRIYEPLYVSDHLCWTGVNGENLHDLLPLPYTEQALQHLITRVNEVQHFLGRPILLENISSYLTFRHSDMTEWEFIAELSRRTDCGILLDINNIFVSATNHGFDPVEYMNGIPEDRVFQMHLAGYTDLGGFYIDTHDHPVSTPVWKLYEKAVERFGAVPTLIEWDDKIPPFEVLEKEAARATKIREKILGANHQQYAGASLKTGARI